MQVEFTEIFERGQNFKIILKYFFYFFQVKNPKSKNQDIGVIDACDHSWLGTILGSTDNESIMNAPKNPQNQPITSPDLKFDTQLSKNNNFFTVFLYVMKFNRPFWTEFWNKYLHSLVSLQQMFTDLIHFP